MPVKFKCDYNKSGKSNLDSFGCFKTPIEYLILYKPSEFDDPNKDPDTFSVSLDMEVFVGTEQECRAILKRFFDDIQNATKKWVDRNVHITCCFIGIDKIDGKWYVFCSDYDHSLCNNMLINFVDQKDQHRIVGMCHCSKETLEEEGLNDLIPNALF